MKFEELASNASVLIVAGSETTATLLSAAVYFLCANPRALDLLVEEVRSAYAQAEDIDLISTQNLRYMQAVLDETLRMYPPVAGGGSPRKIAKGGSLVAGYYVPENVSEICMIHIASRVAADTIHHRRWLRTTCGLCIMTRNILLNHMISFPNDGLEILVSRMIDSTPLSLSRLVLEIALA